MTVKELIDKLQQFNGDRVVLVEDTEYGEFQWTKEVNSINANGLYVIRKAGSNRASFIKFND